jgi:hypothetical protein
MYDTLAAKLYEAVWMVDFAFMTVMAQINPYYKGLFLLRRDVIYIMFASAFVALILGLLFAIFIDDKAAPKWMRFVSIVSIFLYPISATVVNFVSYLKVTKALILFAILQTIKFTFLFIMKEGLLETIKENHQSNGDRFMAFGSIAETILKMICFSVFGTLITKAMSSSRIQKTNPYNYGISFLILSLPLLISYWLLKKAQRIRDIEEREKKK